MNAKNFLLIVLLGFLWCGCAHQNTGETSNSNVVAVDSVNCDSIVSAVLAKLSSDSFAVPTSRNMNEWNNFVPMQVLQISQTIVFEDNSEDNQESDSEIPLELDDDVVEICIYEDDAPPVQFAEKQPEFPGGPEALQKILKEETQYPEGAKEARAQGTVMVQFIVERDGSISDIKILSSVFPALDQEAIRVCKAMPKWHPGENHNQKVRTYYRMPVQFSLA